MEQENEVLKKWLIEEKGIVFDDDEIFSEEDWEGENFIVAL